MALGRGVAEGFGGMGVAILSNSDTVTDLNPFRSNWSNVAGMASRVGG